MPCHDARRHQQVVTTWTNRVAQAGAPGVVPAHPGCSIGPYGPADECENSTHGNHPFHVCANCVLHSLDLLLLDQLNGPMSDFVPIFKAYAESNYDRLSERIQDRQFMAGTGRSAALPIQPAPGPGLIPMIPPGGGPVNPIAPPALTPNPPWSGFLARVCDDCERWIRSEQFHRTPAIGAGGASIARSNKARDEWDQYPNISCTCRHELGIAPARAYRNPRQRPRLCFRHLEAKFRELERKKDANDTWLRNVAFDPTRPVQQVLVNAATVTGANAIPPTLPLPPGAVWPPVHAVANGRPPNRKDFRMATGEWRACRCGNEIDYNIPFQNNWVAAMPGGLAPPVALRAEAFVCMACEGYYTIGPAAQSRFNGRWYDPLQVQNNWGNPSHKMGRKAI